jgi:iron complex transport system substrate-binding protein
VSGRVVVAVVLAFSAACSRSHAPPANETAARVVSLSPSTTETLFAIGAGSAVVGRSHFCNYPPEVLKLPDVGGYVDSNFESILVLAPNLVVGARGPSGRGLVDKLEAHGIATYFPESDSFADIDQMIEGIGARTGHDAEAKKVVADLDAREAAIANAVASEPKPRVLLVFGLEPVVVAGPSTFADEMLRRAGAVNAIAEGTGYPTIGMERVISLDPDLVVNAAMAESHGAQRIAADSPGWGSVRAVKVGHVAALDDEAVLRPGPRVADGLRTLAHAIHPNVALP